MSELWVPSVPCVYLVLRVAIVYTALILLLRLSGKRQVGQMGIAPFVALLLISNAVQNAMNGGDNSLSGGLILATVLIVLSYLFEVVTYRSKAVERLVQGRPTLLVHHGKLLPDHLHRELLNIRELRAILRRQGIHDLAEVEEAILESDGFVSVLRRSEPRGLETGHVPGEGH